jgi:hypothetical protein
MEVNVHHSTKGYSRKIIPYFRLSDERNKIHVSFVVLVKDGVQREARAGCGVGTVPARRDLSSFVLFSCLRVSFSSMKDAAAPVRI